MHNKKIREQIELFRLEWAEVADRSGYTWEKFHRDMTRRELSPVMRRKVCRTIRVLSYAAHDKNVHGGFKPWEMYGKGRRKIERNQ